MSNSSDIQAIIFDFFGVFRTDSSDGWLARNHIPREGDYTRYSELQDMGKLTRSGFLNHMSTLSGHPVTITEMDEGVELNQELIALARHLHAHYPIGLLSNAPSAYIREVITSAGLDDVFDELIISSEVGLIKPQPEFFKLALKRLELEPERALFIDDRQQNVQAAQALGMSGLRYESVPKLELDLVALGIRL